MFKHLRALGIVLPMAMEVSSTDAIKQMVSVGLGLAMVSAATIRTEVTAGTLIILDVPDLAVNRRFTRLLVKERPVSASAQAFLALLAEQHKPNF
jgi:DNA-binding transcriptional LysR family regulator